METIYSVVAFTKRKHSTLANTQLPHQPKIPQPPNLFNLKTKTTFAYNTQKLTQDSVLQFELLPTRILHITGEKRKRTWCHLRCTRTLIKKKIKFFSFMGKFSCKVIYEEGLPNIRGNAQMFNHIWEEAVSHI
jgi:hypothetical protein